MRTTLAIFAVCVVTFRVASWSGSAAYAQPTPTVQPAAEPKPTETPPAFPWEGEVTGSNVYVRSGAGVNWYPTTKLHTGDRVLVMAEKFGWYQITPPKGSISYVDKAMVERHPDGKTGAIKQDKVYVSAGSEIENRKSAIQVVLDKGATVEIQGEAEGFYKITPPRGSALYISKTYVEPVAPRHRTGLVEQYASGAAAAGKTDERPKPESITPPTAQAAAPLTPAGGEVPATEPPPSGVPAAGQEEGQPLETDASIEALQKKAGGQGQQPSTPPGHTRTAAKEQHPAAKPAPTHPRYEVLLNQLENLLQAELRRPPAEQDVPALMNRYEEVAAQKEDRIPAEIAKIRIQQLKDWQALVAARDQSVASTADLEAFRAQLNEKRMEIMRRRVEQAALKYDLEGELRRSFAFAQQQRRYRLVDPVKGETIAYVDVPPTLNVNVDDLIGRVVGITASEKTFSPSARVPIVVAAAIVDLSPRNLPGGTATPPQPTGPENTPASEPKPSQERPGAVE
jgi:hypothetical protein